MRGRLESGGRSALIEKYGDQSAGVLADPALVALMKRLKGIHEDGNDLSLSRWYESPVRVGLIDHGFEEIRQLSRQHHFEVIVAIFPFLGPVMPRRWSTVYEIVSYRSAKVWI